MSQVDTVLGSQSLAPRRRVARLRLQVGVARFSSGEALVLGVRTRVERGALKSILLVDDSRFMRQANEKALARAGYVVVTANDGEEALRIAHSSIPDLILLDMLLPKLGGQEVLQALRSNLVTASIPVVVLSSLPQKNAAKLMKAGATAYFEKSKLDLDQNAESLLQIVKKTLDGWQDSAESSAPAGTNCTVGLSGRLPAS